MKNDQYFKLEVGLLTSDPVIQLIDELGMCGWGLYVALLVRLRQNDNLQASCSPSMLKAMAVMWKTSAESIDEVIHKPYLFQVDEEQQVFTSVYMNGVMKALLAKRNDKEVNEESTVRSTVKRAANGRFTVSSTIEEERKEKKKKNNNNNNSSNINSCGCGYGYDCKESLSEGTTVAAAPVAAATAASQPDMPAPVAPESAPPRPEASFCSWQKLLVEMEHDRSWMQMVSNHSGLAKLFLDHQKELVKIFEDHIVLYDKGSSIRNLGDARRYFVNFLARGSRTNLAVRERLLDLEQRQPQLQPPAGGSGSPFETFENGKRTYFGHEIPSYAPPRPNAEAVWDEADRQWER